ncbi:MAG: UvrD-helicase domain-containing protein [Proteobacteria bacterium]|nr:UvrD-helicase domain-containing protein [Pseudomonadota bacterium]
MSDLPLHLQGLNPPQLDAVQTIEGPLLILAGAGSGKTRVLMRRVAHMLYSGIKPWNILAVTFTNKAAAEMKKRVRAMVGSDADKLTVSTFHSACVRILRIEAKHLGYTNNFAIYDADDQKRMIKQILKDKNIDAKRFTPNNIRSNIDRAKNKRHGPDDMVDVPRQVSEVFAEYEARLKTAGAVDFNDIINKVVDVFEQQPEVLAKWRNRYRYMMVDEYQDTNRAQYQLISLMAGDRGNLAVVGDDDQSIYSFRGADIRNILDFEADFPNAKVVKLEQNYRSSSRILKAAMAVVTVNKGRKDKELWTEAAEGAPLKLLVARDENEEAQKVAARISAGIRQGRRPEDFAVIYRTNARSRPFEQAFRRMNIPHVLVGTRKFYERREVRDMIGYLKLVLNPANEMAFLRVINVPRRGLGPKAVEKIRAEAAARDVPIVEACRILGGGRGKQAESMRRFADLIQQLTAQAVTSLPGELVQTVARETGYRAELEADATEEALGRIENIDALAADIASDEFTLPEELDSSDPLNVLAAFLDRASLAGQADELPDGGRVTLMTAHLAKGLEYPVVFVAGLVEGSFPLTREESEERLEEERRLAYVAFTRAEQELILTRSMMRIVYGTGPQRCTPSRFLDDVPRDLMEGWTDRKPVRRAPSVDPTEARKRLLAFTSRHAKKKPDPVASSASESSDDGIQRTITPESPAELRVGRRVLHPEFGEGIIRTSSGSPQNPRLTIEFAGRRRRTLFAGFSRLEIIVG